MRHRGGNRLDIADRVEVVQFKYSIAKANEPIMSGSMTKTLRKFAASEADIRKTWDDDGLAKASFELVTDHPINPDVLLALNVVRIGAPMAGRSKSQSDILVNAIGPEGEQLAAFAGRLTVTGTGGPLDRVDHSNLATLASWSGATDSVT